MTDWCGCSRSSGLRRNPPALFTLHDHFHHHECDHFATNTRSHLPAEHICFVHSLLLHLCNMCACNCTVVGRTCTMQRRICINSSLLQRVRWLRRPRFRALNAQWPASTMCTCIKKNFSEKYINSPKSPFPYSIDIKFVSHE